jgi:hypothetical protein
MTEHVIALTQPTDTESLILGDEWEDARAEQEEFATVMHELRRLRITPERLAA